MIETNGMKTAGREIEITKKDLNRLFWRSIPVETAYNSERMHNTYYIFALTPILKKIYGSDKQAMSDALKRHIAFYNATPQIEPWIVGITAALEVENAKNNNQMGETVNAIKTGLMGPMSVIGDSLFFTGGFRVIAASVGAALCMAGNPLGLLLYFLIFNIPNYISHYFGIYYGYKIGGNFIEKVVASGLMKKITDVALMVGLTVLGTLTSAYVALSTQLIIPFGEAPFELQSVFDEICPNVLPLALTLTLAWLMRKKNVSATVLMVTVIVAGVILGSIGVI